jgi:hypothetical protein
MSALWRTRTRKGSPISIGAYHPVFKCDTFWVVFGEPTFGGFLIGKDLEMIDVANPFAGVDLDPYSHWSFLKCLGGGKLGAGKLGAGSRMSLIRRMISVTTASAREKSSKSSPLMVVPSVRSACAARIAA